MYFIEMSYFLKKNELKFHYKSDFIRSAQVHSIFCMEFLYKT